MLLWWLIVLLYGLPVNCLINSTSDQDDAAEFYDDLLRTKYNEGQRFILFPDGAGKIHVIDLEKTSDVDNRFNTRKDVYILIYTQKNPSNPVIILSHNKSGILSSELIDLKKPFKVVVHGWNDDRYGDMAVEVRDAFLDKTDVNVMVIDWSEGSNTHYGIAVLNVPKTAEYLSSFFTWLIGKGVPVDNFHFVGHSLGAHVVGITGRFILSGKISHITGLDPALPLWDKFSKRIRHTDGKYVEIIHTNIGLFGIEDALGSNDFYPNGGFLQPGCGIIGFGCSHKRAFKYFAESIQYDRFKGIQCSDLRELLNRRCSNLTSLNMGGINVKTPTGIFYLETKKQSPFYLG